MPNNLRPLDWSGTCTLRVCLGLSGRTLQFCFSNILIIYKLNVINNRTLIKLKKMIINTKHYLWHRENLNRVTSALFRWLLVIINMVVKFITFGPMSIIAAFKNWFALRLSRSLRWHKMRSNIDGSKFQMLKVFLKRSKNLDFFGYVKFPEYCLLSWMNIFWIFWVISRILIFFEKV